VTAGRHQRCHAVTATRQIGVAARHDELKKNR
jgi:hypothetical protein